MDHQDCGTYGPLPTHCGHCGASLPTQLARFFCPSCQRQVPVTRRVTMSFETVESHAGDQGVKVSVGDATKILHWDSFASPLQLWLRVGELVHHALIWGHTPDSVDQVEAERAAEIDAMDCAQAGLGGNPTDLGDLDDL